MILQLKVDNERSQECIFVENKNISGKYSDSFNQFPRPIVTYLKILQSDRRLEMTSLSMGR